jgi:threonine/homoserine/homoserine lactone efflux protein
MTLTALLVFAGALVLNAGTPGPTIAALVARVLTHGAASILPFLAALWIGEVLWLTAAVMGLSFLAQSFHEVFLALKYAGAAYLFYLAWKMWHAPAELHEAELPKTSSALALFGSGMAITVGNPKLMGFYLALLPAIVDLAHLTLGGWAALVATQLIVLIAIDLTWVTSANYARRWLKTPRAVRLSNRIGATAMGGAAVVIATR